MQSKNSQQKIRARQREIEAMRLRVSGMSYRVIGESIGVGESRAYQIIDRAMKRIIAHHSETAELLRALELQRLDRMFQAIWDRAIAGGLEAISVGLKIMERRSKLVGMDAPPVLGQIEEVCFKVIPMPLPDPPAAAMQHVTP